MSFDVHSHARRSTRRLALTASAVLAAVAGLVAVTVKAFTDHSPADPVSAISPASTSSDPGRTAQDDPAAVSGGMPADLRWSTDAGVLLPVSALAGPQETEGGLARGFRHDPAGAVLAAVHLTIRVSPQLGPAVFEPTLREQVVGPDAASMRDQVTQLYNKVRERVGVPYGQPVGRLYAAIGGYRVERYDPAEAAVRLLVVATDDKGTTVHSAGTVHMRWIGGDWRLVAPPGGNWQHVITVIGAADAARFIPLAPATTTPSPTFGR